MRGVGVGGDLDGEGPSRPVAVGIGDRDRIVQRYAGLGAGDG